MKINDKTEGMKKLGGAALFALIFLIVYFTISSFETTFYYDSNHYYGLSYSFVNDSGFNILNYPNTIRGMVFPFILMCSRNLFEFLGDFESYKLSFSIFYSASIFHLVPRLSIIIFNKKPKFYQLIGFTVCLCYFWSGLLFYPLTDLISVIFLGCVFVIANKIETIDRNKKIINAFMGLVLGILIYSAYNIRTIFIFPMILIPVYYLFRKRIILFMCIIIGVVVTSFPQMMINSKYHDNYSPLVNTDNVYGLGESLNMKALREGIYRIRWESNIDPTLSSSVIGFNNEIGKEILINEDIKQFNDLSDYLSVFIKYPLPLISQYTNHFIQGFDSRFGEIYISDVYSNRDVKVIINLLIICSIAIYMMSLTCAWSACLKRDFKYYLSKILSINAIFSVSVCMLLVSQSMGHTEPRYFLIIHILMYLAFFVYIDYKKMIYYIRENKVAVFLVCCILSLVFLTTWNSVLSNPENAKPIGIEYER